MTKPPVDPRAVLAQIAGDEQASAVHRVRAAKALLGAEPKRREPAGEDPINAAALALIEASDIPVIARHRNAPIHDFQTETRIREIVQPEIDRVLDTEVLTALMAIAGDLRRAPEARLLAAAKCRALRERTSAVHAHRAAVDLDLLAAMTAGLNLRWLDPATYASLLDTPPEPGEPGAAPRPAQHGDALRRAQGDR